MRRASMARRMSRGELLSAALALATLASCHGAHQSARVVTLVTDDARGLGANAPVYVAGVEIGTVQATELAGRNARVELALAPHAPELTQGTCATIRSYGLSGAMHVELEVPPSGPPLGRGPLAPCAPTQDNLEARLERILTNVAQIAEVAANGRGVVGRLLRDEKLAERFERWLTEQEAAAASAASAASGAGGADASPADEGAADPSSTATASRAPEPAGLPTQPGDRGF